MPMPVTPYRGDSYLFEGLSQAGRSIGQGISRWKEKAEAEEKEAKEQARLFKSLQETADIIGIAPKDVTTTWDLPRLQGAVQGHMIKNGMEEAARKRAEDAANEGARRQAGGFYGAISDRSYAPTAPELGRYYESDATEMPNKPLRPMGEVLHEALQQYPDVTRLPDVRRDISGLLEKYMPEQQTPDWNAVKPREGKTTGGLGYLYGKSGQFQFTPNTDGAVDGEGNIGPGMVRTLPNGATQTFDGKRWINTPVEKEPKVPDSFNKTMDEISADIAGAQSILGDTAAKPEQRGRAQRMLKSAQARGQATIDRYANQGHFNDDQRAAHYAEIGLPAPGTKVGSGRPDTAKPPPAEGPVSPKATAIREQFKAGKLSKEEALKQLKAMGFQ